MQDIAIIKQKNGRYDFSARSLSKKELIALAAGIAIVNKSKIGQAVLGKARLVSANKGKRLKAQLSRSHKADKR